MTGHSTGKTGFTLVEVLVAILIFAILVTVLFSSFRNIHTSAQALERDDVYYEMGQAALSRMVRDLQSLYVTRPPIYKKPGFNEDPDPYRVLGEVSTMGGESFSKLRFASLEHISFGGEAFTGVSEITYYVHRMDTDTYVLRRKDQIWPFDDFEETAKDPILCEALRALNIAYLDTEGESQDQWDSDSDDSEYATPRAVEITLELGEEDDTITLGTVVMLPVYREAKDGSEG